ncbi:gamma-tubulin complex DGRIP91/SPC98 component [Panaeolus papilionaceus]|nr:gamma-tubulin complex DGRIP91/SPC98 component [Panaeolus papilionaceus]
MSSNIMALLDPLINAYVPTARIDESLRLELATHCRDILNSRIGHRNDGSFSQLVDLVKRRILHLSSDATTVSRFSNLLSRLQSQPVLSRKQEAILFLFTLSSLDLPHASLPQLHSPLTTGTKARADVKPTQSGHLPPDRQVKSISKAQSLKDFLQHKDISRIDESLLIRDALYLMQGISGMYIRFTAPRGNSKGLVFECEPGLILPATKALIHRLAELGYLYSRVDTFVREREGATGVGMIEQSLCHYLQGQLTEYYRLIAVLEAQMSTSTQDPNNPDNPESGLSLRRLDVWVNDWRLRMRMMSVCVEGAREVHGGALVNLIHGYTDNGDPFIRKFTDELLAEVSHPFFSTLHKWLFSGELYDPYEEFFVTTDSSLGQLGYVHPSSLSGGIQHMANEGSFGGITDMDEQGTFNRGQRAWEAKYQFRKDMLPTFVGESFGRKIFSTGKSLNFIRYGCLDSDWVATREKMNTTGGTVKYGDISGLERSIDDAYHLASHRLFEMFTEKFHLLDHLAALKNFLLLNHGDFADQLLDTVGSSLGKPANTLHRHNLTANLETAIRSSYNESNSADVLRRLDARMLEYSHGEIGWDVFTLEYKVDPPLDTVLNQDSMESYLRLFRHLWQLKRIGKTLYRGWVRVTGGAKTFLRLSDLKFEWHRVRIAMSEMIHFIRQLEAYYRLEVIECSWQTFIDFLNKREGDLDALIGAHRSYLDTISKKILLHHPKPGKEELLLRQLNEIFALILQYRETTDTFYNYCLSRSALEDQALDEERGVYTGAVNLVEGSDTLSSTLSLLETCGTAFSEKVQGLVQQLQVHPDLDCRFLGIRLSFSEFYKRQNRP